MFPGPWNFKLLWDACKLLEGNQQATEGNRNMTALLSLVSVGAKTEDELFRVATKNLELSRKNLMLEASGAPAKEKD